METELYSKLRDANNNFICTVNFPNNFTWDIHITYILCIIQLFLVLIEQMKALLKLLIKMSIIYSCLQATKYIYIHTYNVHVDY